MLNKPILSLLLSTASAASLAADYYVVVSSKGRADSDPHSAIRVSAQPEDPWISATIHNDGGTSANADNDTHSMLYGEETALPASWSYWRDNRQGANVFVR